MIRASLSFLIRDLYPFHNSDKCPYQTLMGAFFRRQMPICLSHRCPFSSLVSALFSGVRSAPLSPLIISLCILTRAPCISLKSAPFPPDKCSFHLWWVSLFNSNKCPFYLDTCPFPFWGSQGMMGIVYQIIGSHNNKLLSLEVLMIVKIIFKGSH